MDVKRCDRCGKFYIPKEENGLEAAMQSIQTSLMNFMKKATKDRRYMLSTAIEKAVDLCPDCSKSLNFWIFGKEERNENESDA